tara:strand:- start:84 stop:605 length:522 start_codon:yes stop_codon:yes gene_type:complete
MKIKLIILDVDGVLTDGKKYYNEKGLGKLKTFCDKDFTAIKRIKAAGVNVCFLSGDANINQAIAKNRNIDFYFSRGRSKCDFLGQFSQFYGCNISEMAFIGDDLFDLDLLEKVGYSFCPSDSCREVKGACVHTLTSKGGDNVVMEMHDYLVDNQLIDETTLDSIITLDAAEKF